MRRGLFRTGSGGCGAVLFVGAILGLFVRQLRQQIRMRPFRVARLGTFLRADAFPQRGRLTHALGAQLHAHQAFERAFRRASDGAFAAQHLTKLFDMRNMRHARTPHDGIHPALHQGKQILQRLHGLLLLRSVRERHLGDVHRAGHGIRIDGLRLTDLLLHGIHVDGDATRVFAQQRLEAGHQPRHGGEQPGMRKLLQRKIAHHFVHVDVQRLRVFGHVLHDQSAGGILQQRDALIEAAAHLMGQVAGGTPQLHGERRVADESHQLRRILHLVRNRNFDGACENPGNLGLDFAVAETLRQNRSQSVVHRFGHGGGELRPRVDCVLHPAGAGEQLRLALRRVEFASGIKPQVRLADGTSCDFAGFGVHAAVRSGTIRLLQRERFRQFDVDRPLFHGLLHISHGVESAGGERLHHGLDLFGLGQRARILTHQLVAYGFRHVGKLVPCHLALNRSEAIDKPLADRILIHTVSCLCSTRLLSSLPSIVWEAWPICRKHSEFTPKAHVTGRLKAFCHVSDDVGVRSDGGSMFALGDISPDRSWPCSAC